MADIRNPLTGRTFKQVDSTLAEILVDAGMMEYNRAAVQPMEALRPKENTFTIGRTQWGKLCITLTTPGGRVARYDSPEYSSELRPDKIRDVFKTLAWSADAQARILQGPEVPEAIINDFVAQATYECRVKGATNALLEKAQNDRGTR